MLADAPILAIMTLPDETEADSSGMQLWGEISWLTHPAGAARTGVLIPLTDECRSLIST